MSKRLRAKLGKDLCSIATRPDNVQRGDGEIRATRSTDMAFADIVITYRFIFVPDRSFAARWTEQVGLGPYLTTGEAQGIVARYFNLLR